jgi:hypothetical protein
MARNRVQFQKGLSKPEFERRYGSEEQCRAAVVGSRWPNGFECPNCGGTQYCLVKSRDLFQCTACRRKAPRLAALYTGSAASRVPGYRPA